MTITATRAPSLGVVLSERADAVLTPDVLAAAHRRLQRKALAVVAWFVASYVAVLAASSIVVGVVACVSLALAMVAVGFNIQHDANHNALFATGGSRRLSTANRRAGWAINAIGGDASRWLGGHVRRHHAAPNVDGRDDDIDLAPFARLAPSQEHRSWHRYQHLYLWPAYALTAVGIFVTDVTATIAETRAGGPRGVLVKMVASKAAFVAVMVGGPALVHTPVSVAAGAVLVAGLAGLLLGVVFQLAHTVDGAEFRAADADTPCAWHEWQIRSTADFAHGTGWSTRALTWFVGGLNHQVEHHLFPQLPHTAYPLLAPVVTDVCTEVGLTHRVLPGLRAALGAHHAHLRAMGAPPAR